MFWNNQCQHFIDNAEIKLMKQRFAVIYGAGSKIGKAFAKYLTEKNYGLILIDFNYDRLRSTELFL